MKNTNNKNQSNIKKQKGIENPVNTLYGKIIIWMLIIIMGGMSLFGLIFALIELF